MSSCVWFLRERTLLNAGEMPDRAQQVCWDELRLGSPASRKNAPKDYTHTLTLRHTHTHTCPCTQHSLTNACRSRRFDLHRPCPLASAGRAGVGCAQQTRCDRGRRWVDTAMWVARRESVAGSGPPTATARTARLTRTSTKSGISAIPPGLCDQQPRARPCRM